jgi:ribose-phosphate pyrophosphokinase
MGDPIKIFANAAARHLAEKICDRLSTSLGEAQVGRFNDGEPDVKILENVRKRDVFIISDIHGPTENLLQAVLLADAARMSSAGRVTLVFSKFGGDRGDRKDEPRKPILVKTYIHMIQTAHPDRAIVLDIHSEQSLAIFDPIVVDHLFGSPIACDHFRKFLKDTEFVVASADRGGVVRAEKYARLLGHKDVVVFSKRRKAPGEVDRESIKILGDVEGRAVVFIDDMLDTGGTLIADAGAAKAAGATKAYAFCTHGLFTKDAFALINASDLDQVFVTDSVYHDEVMLSQACPKVKILSCAPLLADAIRRTHEGDSLSELIP